MKYVELSRRYKKHRFHRSQPRLLRLRIGKLLRFVEASDGQVVHHLLHLLQIVLDPIKLLPQVVVLQIEQPEKRNLLTGPWSGPAAHLKPELRELINSAIFSGLA